MMNLKKLLAVVVVVGVLGTAGAVFAATTTKTPADIVSGIVGKSVEDVTKDRVAGKTYGTIANEAGKLDEFKKQMLANSKALLDQRVKDKTLTQERADAIYKAMVDNQAICDGTGNAGLGMNGTGCGAGGAGGCGMATGQQRGSGQGMGGGRMGAGRGFNR